MGFRSALITILVIGTCVLSKPTSIIASPAYSISSYNGTVFERVFGPQLQNSQDYACANNTSNFIPVRRLRAINYQRDQRYNLRKSERPSFLKYVGNSNNYALSNRLEPPGFSFKDPSNHTLIGRHSVEHNISNDYMPSDMIEYDQQSGDDKKILMKAEPFSSAVEDYYANALRKPRLQAMNRRAKLSNLKLDKTLSQDTKNCQKDCKEKDCDCCSEYATECYQDCIKPIRPTGKPPRACESLSNSMFLLIIIILMVIWMWVIMLHFTSTISHADCS